MSRPLPSGRPPTGATRSSDERAPGAGRAFHRSVAVLNVVFATALLVVTALIAVQPSRR